MKAPVSDPEPSPALTDLLRVLLENGGSDLHIQAGEVPIGRFNGELGRFELPPLLEDEVVQLVREVLGVLKTIAATNDGLVLVTEATGSGKSATLAALLHHINSTQACHVMTLEDPIEFVPENKLSLINQREISVDSPTFASAPKPVPRQDPHVILIGEMALMAQKPRSRHSRQFVRF